MLTYNEFVLESKLNEFDSEIIDESFKHIVTFLLGMASVGSGLAQSNDEINKNLNNTTFTQQAKSFINDEESMSKLKDIVGDVYYNKIDSNKNSIEDRLDSKYKETEHINKVSLKDTSEIESMLKQGWSPVDIKITKDTIVTNNKGDVIEFEIKSSYPNNAVFKTGSYDLTEDFKYNLDSLINTLEIDPGRNITHITIETSTDKEPITGGNKKLSENRAGSVKSSLDNIISNVEISTDIKFDQGLDIYTKNMTSDEKDSARLKTAEFRYVNITIHYIKSGYTTQGESVTSIEQKEFIVFKKMTKINKHKKHLPSIKIDISFKKFKRRGNSFECIND